MGSWVPDEMRMGLVGLIALKYVCFGLWRHRAKQMLRPPPFFGKPESDHCISLLTISKYSNSCHCSQTGRPDRDVVFEIKTTERLGVHNDTHECSI